MNSSRACSQVRPGGFEAEKPGMNLAAGILLLAALDHGPGPREVARARVVRHGTAYALVVFRVDVAALKGLGGAQAMEQLRRGQVASEVEVTTLVEMSGARRKEILETLLRTHWPGGGFDPASPEARPFLDFGARTLEVNQRFEYRFPAGQGLWMRFGREPWRKFPGGRLRQAVLDYIYIKDDANRHALEILEAALTPAR